MGTTGLEYDLGADRVLQPGPAQERLIAARCQLSKGLTTFFFNV